ncbi:MAG: right-handed parallel beta-helix repeat-containing protein [Spirochaetota bacterium]
MGFRRTAYTLFASALCAWLLPAASWYIATNGNDAWSGTLPAVNAAKTDGPFATIARAQEAVRTAGKSTETVIELRGGMYTVTKPIVFTPADSGTANAPVSYRSYKGERVVISGGMRMTGWKKSGQLWSTRIADGGAGKLYFTSLFVNGERRIRARTPNAGKYFFTRSIIKKTPEYNSPTKGIMFSENDIQKWSNLEEAYIVLFHNWVSSINYLRVLDLKKKRVEFWQESPGFFFGTSVRYFVENVFEALDAPGEWFLNTNGTLFYYPLPGEDTSIAQVIAPVIDRTLVSFEGDVGKDAFVEHIRFQGLSFQHVNALLDVEKVKNSVQGAHLQTGAITAAGMRHVVFEDCEITHVGEHAISLKFGCKDNVFRRLHMHDLGGGGVYMGDDQNNDGASFVIERNVVDNCFIHDGGHIFHAGIGVFMGRCAHGNTVSHNEICDLSYSGVSLGWSWSGKQKSMTSGNIAEYNHIHHIGNGVLCDMAGIYTLGVSPGTRINNNLIHDVTRFEQGHLGYGGHGIYLDAGSSEILVENNIVHDIRDSAFFPHSYEYPYGDIVRNNIFAFAGTGLYFTGNKRVHDDRQVDFYGNIVYCTNGAAVDGIIHDPTKLRFASNLYWNSADGLTFITDTFDAWKAKGNDAASLFADPLFENAAKRDLRLKQSSPALSQIGFTPIDMSSIGLYGDTAWTALPKKIVNRAFEAAPPLKEATRIIEDFESTDAGGVPAEITATTENKGDSIAVDAVKGAGGAQALKITDAPGLKYDFNPHWNYRASMKPGKYEFSCDIMNSRETPANFYFEMRDWSKTIFAGPSVSIDMNGAVRVGEREITVVEPGTWFQLHIAFDTSVGAPGSFAVSITPAGGTRVKAECPFTSDKFKTINWVGFASMSTNTAVFYIDNFDLRAVK